MKTIYETDPVKPECGKKYIIGGYWFRGEICEAEVLLISPSGQYAKILIQNQEQPKWFWINDIEFLDLLPGQDA